MKIYFATWLRDYTNGPTLTKVGGNARLLSYHLYREEEGKNEYPPDTLAQYAATGVFESRKTLRGLPTRREHES